MNILCPQCQKQVTVPDSQAGQSTQCPHCQHRFNVPVLPKSPFASTAPPSAPPPPPAPDVFSIAPEPPRQNAPPRVEPAAPAPQVRPTPPAAERPSAPLVSPAPRPKPLAAEPIQHEQGLRHSRSFEISPPGVALVPPIILVLLFLTLFFSWAGMYPGGNATYTQNAWQIGWGGLSIDAVGDKVLGLQDKLKEMITWSGWLLFYDVLILLAVVLALAIAVLGRSAASLPPAVQKFWPWRFLVLNLLLATALVALGIQSSLGFGVEKAAIAVAREEVAENRQSARTPEENQTVDIKEGVALGKLQLRRTWAYDAALLLHLLALVGAGFELWLDNRKGLSPPRVTIQW